MPVRTITKELAAEQDMLLGRGEVVQTRAGVATTVNRLPLIKTIANIAILRNAATAADHVDPASFEMVNVEGHTTSQDGGGGYFYWDSLAPATDNNGTVIASVIDATGTWRRVDDGNVVNPKHFGAIGDGLVDDTVAFVNAIAVRALSEGVFHIPSGEYRITANLDFTAVTKIMILGDGRQHTVLRFEATATKGFVLDMSTLADHTADRVEIKDLTMRTEGTTAIGIEINSAIVSTAQVSVALIERVHFEGISSFTGWLNAIHTLNCYGVTVSDCYGRFFATGGATDFWKFTNATLTDASYFLGTSQTRHYSSDTTAGITVAGGGGAVTPNSIGNTEINNTQDFTFGNVTISKTGVKTLLNMLTDLNVGDISSILSKGADSLANTTNYTEILSTIFDNTDGSEDGTLALRTIVAGLMTTQLSTRNGVVVGNPTGGFQGNGSLNVESLFINGGSNLSVTAESLASTGYVQLSNGLILQWGANSTPSAASTDITLPIAFPTNHFIAIGSPTFAVDLTQWDRVVNLSLTQIRIGQQNTGASAGVMAWLAIGN